MVRVVVVQVVELQNELLGIVVPQGGVLHVVVVWVVVLQIGVLGIVVLQGRVLHVEVVRVLQIRPAAEKWRPGSTLGCLLSKGTYYCSNDFGTSPCRCTICRFSSYVNHSHMLICYHIVFIPIINLLTGLYL